MMHRSLVTLLVSLAMLQTIALAQSPPPPTFAYKLNMSAGQGSGSMDYTMDVAIKSTNSDGSRAASLTIHAPRMTGMDKETLDATITPFGAITMASTGQMPDTKHFNPLDLSQQKQMSQAAKGPMMQSLISPFNAFANGLANAPSFKTGATWQAQSNESMTEVTYTVTGHEERSGRDTAIITMKSPPGGSSVTEQGNYDPQARLVVAVHCEIRQTADANGAQILDVAMTNP